MTNSRRFANFWLFALIAVSFLALPDPVRAQATGTVTGHVTTNTGTPISGAAVSAGSRQAMTGADGRYSISGVPAGTQTVRATVIGYTESSKTVTVQAGQTATADFELSAEVLQLEGLVAVGYGTQEKVNLTGAVGSVDGEELAKRPVANVSEALQGSAAGLTIVDRGGAPGQAGTDIKIRGIGTLSNANPLILIDGIEGALNDIAPNDVASVTVLKDAASAAIYGSRAANGVILVTTKRGSATDELKVTYDGYYGIQDVVAFPKLVGKADYFEIINETYTNAGQQPRYSDEYIQKTLAGNDPLNYPWTDWIDLVYNPAPIQNHSVRVSGGNDLATLALSLNYLDQQGLVDLTEADRYSMRLNTDWHFSDRIRGVGDISLMRSTNQEPTRLDFGMRTTVHDVTPTTVAIYPDGTYGWSSAGHNPLAYLRENGVLNRRTDRQTASGQLSYDITDGLTLRTKAAVENSTWNYKNFVTEKTFYNYFDPTQVDKSWTPNSLDVRDSNDLERTLQALLDYDKLFDVHHVTGLLGYEEIAHDGDEVRAGREGFYNNELQEINAGDANRQTTWGTSSQWRLRSAFGRLGYGYDGRYLLEATARYDGSSRFGEGNQYGFFPSVSAGWRLSEESFLRDVDWLSELKLRGSWGRLGNQQIGLYRSYTSINLGQYYPFGGILNQGAAQTALGNDQITWETTETTDLGLDAAFLDNRLSFTGDIYRKDTHGILLALPVSAMLGVAAPTQNAGKVRNTGWEATASWQDAVNDFQYHFDVNLSDVKNEVVDLAGTGPYIGWGGGETNRYYVIQEGTDIGALYGYMADGLFQTEEEVASHARQAPNTQPGDIIFRDLNDDGIINADDNAVIGSTLPHYTIGSNLGASYRGFDVSLFFQGVLKVDAYVFGSFQEGPVFENYVTEAWIDRWTPDNRDATMPRPRIRTNINTRPVSSFWVQDAKYLKLKNAQIGYTMPPSVTGRLGLSQLRLYATGSNLLTWTKLKSSFDPEVETGRAVGYPQTRILSIGTNLTF